MLKELIKNYNGTKTYNRVLYNTFKDACFVRGLLNNNDEWYLTFQEAATWSSSFQLKQNFVTMLYYSIIYKWKEFFWGGFPIANWWPLTRIETLISSYQTSYNKWSTTWHVTRWLTIYTMSQWHKNNYVWPTKSKLWL